MLDLGKLHKFDYQSESYKRNRTAKVTISKTSGKKQFTGQKKQLKDSQLLNDMVIFVYGFDYIWAMTDPWWFTFIHGVGCSLLIVL